MLNFFIVRDFFPPNLVIVVQYENNEAFRACFGTFKLDRTWCLNQHFSLHDDVEESAFIINLKDFFSSLKVSELHVLDQILQRLFVPCLDRVPEELIVNEVVLHHLDFLTVPLARLKLENSFDNLFGFSSVLR